MCHFTKNGGKNFCGQNVSSLLKMVAHVYYINGCLTKFTPGGVIIPFLPDKFNSAEII